ncbi:hypothetical protein JKP88DRAFT_169820 [Tribonema minus]|uniref:DUF2127 domain-containing protein n=1 Tax=Tribonema minus TaxID=303371 RepID=A0A836CB09_9STRA|nr:hypothetical protein JKP88DRAFT_169820 [Tribonema minus]
MVKFVALAAKLEESVDLNVNKVLQYHAIISIVVGGIAFFLPHGLANTLYGGELTHHLHEVVRMYGALTLAQGWLTHATRQAGDARVKRAMSEAYAVSYGLQMLALARAQWTSPDSHTALNIAGIALFASLSAFYAYVRWRRTIKIFELPTEQVKSTS